jgi:alpha-aminoadipic semialdehyde synthase
MIDGLHGLGHKLLGMGYNTPFMHISMAHTFKSLASAKLTLREMGNTIMDEGLPDCFQPMTFIFTGTGNVSQVSQQDCVYESFIHHVI